MKVYILFTGEYSQRGAHSVHSTEAEAKAVDKLVRREWGEDNEADIEEFDLDEPLCKICGYDEKLHIEHPETWKHEFKASIK